jgi:hypothetical protein
MVAPGWVGPARHEKARRGAAGWRSAWKGVFGLLQHAHAQLSPGHANGATLLLGAM